MSIGRNLFLEYDLKNDARRAAQSRYKPAVRAEYLNIVEIGVPNPAPYVYSPMRGDCPGKRV